MATRNTRSDENRYAKKEPKLKAGWTKSNPSGLSNPPRELEADEFGEDFEKIFQNIVKPRARKA
jgi:hypothetical protein